MGSRKRPRKLEVERRVEERIKQLDAYAILIDVNENKLDGCEGPHQFSKPNEVFEDCVCALCHGRTKRINVIWYERGLKHGARQRIDSSRV